MSRLTSVRARLATGPPALALAAALAVGGCGSAGSPAPDPAASLFTARCGACHTLNGHENPKKQGGDLLGLHIPAAPMRQFVAAMPVRPPLSRSQVDQLTRYVLAVEGRAGR